MACWIAGFAPHLALQATAVGLLVDVPVAITHVAGGKATIYRANRAAMAHGILPNLSASAARVLCEQVVLLPRSHARERQGLEQAALAALPFTPKVVLDQDAVVLEVASSLRLFGGLKRLGQRLKRVWEQGPLTLTYGVAPTPRAAWLIAKARATGLAASHVYHARDLACVLADLPVTLFDWPESTQQALATLGIHTLGNLTQLPRDGVLRRWGSVLRDVDRAYGHAADPRIDYVAPEHFEGSVALIEPTSDAAQVLLAAEQLWQGFALFLNVRGRAAIRHQLLLDHGRSLPPTVLVIATQEATRDAARWKKITQEQLNRTALGGQVYEVRLGMADHQPYQPTNTSLFPGAAEQALQRNTIIETLTARLGPEGVTRIATGNDHRPEQATGQAALAVFEDSVVRFANQPRPAWLLPQPRALILRQRRPEWQGALVFLAGPERIESGWWDNAPARRDYYVARNPHGETVWVYQNLQDERWYLHGFFA